MKFVGSEFINWISKLVFVLGILVLLLVVKNGFALPPATLKTNNPLTDSATKPKEQSYIVEESKMKKYEVTLPDTRVKFEMLPIPGGVFKMGSPVTEADRMKDEGPQYNVRVEPFWMGKYEVTFDEFWVYYDCIDKKMRLTVKRENDKVDEKVDAMTRPTEPYPPFEDQMGKKGHPVICATQYTAKMYCKFLSLKTGHYYRLPTEAEWEYACRAGTTTAYSWGDDITKYDDFAWCYDNSNEFYKKVGLKKPNPWGLHDMHGNVSEWCLDQYVPDFYQQFENQNVPAVFPIGIPTKLYPRVVRGGSWDEDPEDIRSASRHKSDKWWKGQDPQLPQSKWWYTDSRQVGFRVIRPLKRPSEKEIEKYSLNPTVPKELVNERREDRSCVGGFKNE